ncbi:hypothetical protein K9N68_07805 [Kovacikia minuta CCNUW1]|nr:hypothetical protein [Kovacikia minuta]UBF27805.1 hypothetical protein K9N68_07805 [Kovacikia minuta CCNUW1]
MLIQLAIKIAIAGAFLGALFQEHRFDSQPTFSCTGLDCHHADQFKQHA